MKSTIWVLVFGLVVFLGVHSVRIVGEGWRARVMAEGGEKRWKLAYTLVSLVGFGMLIWGYALARQAPVTLWPTAAWTRHLAALGMLPALILLVSAYVPRNGIRARLRHPMLMGTMLWAALHLLANGTLADALLFGSFLLWAGLALRAARRRDALASEVAAPLPQSPRDVGTLAAVLLGTLLWVWLAFWGHGPLFGVMPFPG